MEIHRGYKVLKLKNPVVTLGIFDGVHRGHRILIDTLVRRAAAVKGESVVITFDPHPRLVIEKERKSLSFLSGMEEKIALLEKAHVDHLILIRFTSSFSRVRACDFVDRILVREVGTRHLVIGHDHHFGYRAEGNIETINKCAESTGILVEQVAGLKSKEGFISSSLIREALLKGDIDKANKWLGYCYSLRGKVISGEKIGRKLGFPTANIRPSYRYKLIPSDGVYAVDISVEGEMKPGMLSIGSNPTVNKVSDRKFIEVHIFDFDKDIYGREIEVFFRYRLRDEIRFDTVEELSQQMERDRRIAERLLSGTTSQ